MEIADVFVINKADRKAVNETRRDLEQMLSYRSWRHVVSADCITIATTSDGVGTVGVSRRTEVLSSPMVMSPPVVRIDCDKKCMRSSNAGSNIEPERSAPVHVGIPSRRRCLPTALIRGVPPIRCSKASEREWHTLVTDERTSALGRCLEPHIEWSRWRVRDLIWGVGGESRCKCRQNMRLVTFHLYRRFPVNGDGGDRHWWNRGCRSWLCLITGGAQWSVRVGAGAVHQRFVA